jgi:hypothetical protein
MSSTATAADTAATAAPAQGAGAAPVAKLGARHARWQFWGAVMVVPYLLVFVVFVLYPVGYGLWLARHPQSYVKLVEDPIFFRSVINTAVFLVVAINIKMLVALVLSGFFVTSRWWIKIVSGDLHPAVGDALDSDHSFVPLHAEPGVGRDQHHHLSPDRRRWSQLAQRSVAGTGLRDAGARVEVAAVLDAHPRGRAARHSGASSTRPRRSTVPPRGRSSAS